MGKEVSVAPVGGGVEVDQDTGGPPPPPTPVKREPEAPPPPPPRFEPALGEGPPPPVAPPPTVPDRPGGQVATVKGEELYVVGSTMYDKGFRNQQEYLEAQRAGVMYGPHKGKLVPEGSVLVEARGVIEGKTVTVRYSGEKEGVSQSVLSGLEKDKYRVPITIEDKTSFLTGQQAANLDRLSGKAQFDYLRDIGAIKPNRVYIPGEAGNWSFIDSDDVKQIREFDQELYDTLMTKGFDEYEKRFSSKYITIGDQVMEISEWNKLEEKHQSIAIKENDLDAINRAIVKEISDSVADAPIGAREAFERGGVEAYNHWVEDYNRYIDRNFTELKDGQYISNIELEKIKSESPLLYKDLMDKGYDATFGYIEKVQKENPRVYFGVLQKYGMAPEKSVYVGSLPDGSVQYIAAPDIKREDKTTLQLAKEAGMITAEMLVPGVWLKNLNLGKENQMPAWQIGLNTGLDLLILVPLAGWAARVGGKAILKAGTSTITKSLAKELPKELAKAGEKALAAESKQLAKQLKPVDRLFLKVEKAATATAKAEKAGNIDKFVKAVGIENLAKAEYAQALRKWGTDIAVFNSKLADTAIKGIGKEGLNKAVGLANKADDFANYVAGTTKEIIRAKLAKSFPRKAGEFVAKEAKAYAEIPKTIAEVSKATVITTTKGTKEAAAYLRGVRAIKVPKGISPATTGKEVQARLANLQKAIDKEATKGRARVAKYEGAKRTLGNWDDYIQEAWPPAGRGKWYPKRPIPTTGGGVATVSTIAVTPEQAARYGAPIARTYQLPIKTIAGTRIMTVIVDPDRGTTEIIRTPERVDLPQIIVVEDDKWPIIAPSEPGMILPAVEPKPQVIPIPKKEPKIKVYYIEKPRALSIAEVKPITEASPKTLAEAKTAITTKAAVKVATIVEEKPVAKAMPAAKVMPEAKVTPEVKTKPVTRVIPITRITARPRVAPAPKVAPTPAIKPAIKIAPVTKIVPKPKLKPKPILPLPSGADDTAKRKRIKESTGAVTYNMGKLKIRGKLLDIWHVRLDTGEHIVVHGRVPEGAVEVDGPGSAYKTARRLGRRGFRPFTHPHGAVRASVTPSGVPKGADIRFSPIGRSKKIGQIYHTKTAGGHTLLSRRPLGRRR